MTNRVASLQSKLRQIAQADGKSYQLILTRYFQERLLYRLFMSDYRTHFCLKGGALLYAIEQERSRPTLDIDLLAIDLSNEIPQLRAVFEVIGAIEYETDGVRFDTSELTATPITHESLYPGLWLKIVARLGTIQQVLQIDIGFGDIVTPGPTPMAYPTLLVMEAPQVLAYSRETVIAEKFEAMIDLAQLNSRMKDFYDVYRLLEGGQYTAQTLQDAIRNTFRWRQTVCEASHPLFRIEFANDLQRKGQWKAFLTKSGLDTGLEFTRVMQMITRHLYPIYQQLIAQ